jgi:hypothetical protein
MLHLSSALGVGRYIAGRIVPRITIVLDCSEFRQRFENNTIQKQTARAAPTGGRHFLFGSRGQEGALNFALDPIEPFFGLHGLSTMVRNLGLELFDLILGCVQPGGDLVD